MLGSDVVRMLAQWGLVAWVVTRGDSIAAFAFSSGAYGCASSFFGPARFSFLSQLFSGEQRTRVNGSLSMLGDVLFIAGPLIGTAAVLTLGFNTVLLIDGATFLVAMFFVFPFLSVRREPAVESSNGVPAESEPESAGSSTQNKTPSTPMLPSWVRVGLGTWLVAAVVNGFLGSAGPTWIMNTFDEKSWGFMATALAIGSLLGSAATILKALDRVRFSTLQMLMLILLAGQLLALAFTPAFVLIAAVGAAASLLMTASGIAWDSLGQSLGDDGMVHQFATKDQLVFTAGTPLGMILFAALSAHPGVAAVALAAALVVAAAASSLPAARSPRTADMAENAVSG